MSEGSYAAVDPRLIESEERYRAVIQNASDMIQSVRQDGTFEFVNHAWLEKLGYTQEEVDDLNIWDIIYPESIQHCQALFSEAINGKPIDYMQATFMTKDGRPVPVEGNVTSRFLGKQVVATHGFFRDITERLRAQELEERNSQLEREQQARYLEKMAALGKLSAGLAHELNNPAAAVQRASSRLKECLTQRDASLHQLSQEDFLPEHWQAIDRLLDKKQVENPEHPDLDPLAIDELETGIEEWLEDHNVERAWDLAPGLVGFGISESDLEGLAQALPPTILRTAIEWLTDTLTLRELTEIISRSSHRISELVAAVKGYSHMDRATEHTALVQEGIESTLIILGHRLGDVTIKRDYAPDLPPIRVFGNTLNQVWTNILDNAIDATHGKGTISIRTQHDGDNVVVEFGDNGDGISPSDLACIFEPFFTTKPQGEGTGLGLDTAWRIVTEEHGGTITVESEPGRTVFRITLPIEGVAKHESPDPVAEGHERIQHP